jgi:TonB-dependent receptor-like protein
MGLIGTATTSSQGVVVNDELALMPAFRPGQLLETVPGLVVTSHSGEGKANQYLMRGINLDHGTNLAVFVDGMPINEPTHAHGQGYTDLNFMIPELATNIQFTKGPYFAGEGDFALVGSVHLSYLDTIDDEVSATLGTLGFRRYVATGASAAGDGALLGALELQHYDGPWDNPDEQRKINAVLRYTAGDQNRGYSLTGMFYDGVWNATTDQPVRAMTEGLISRFGSLDPSDGGRARRASLSTQYHNAVGDGQWTANAYVIGNHLTLWNNFTHYLADPVNGDQEAQHEDRTTIGGGVSYARSAVLFGLNNEFTAGLQTRHDVATVSRIPTKDRMVLPAADNPLGFSERDQARLGSVGGFAQATTHWAPWLRSVLGVREDYASGRDAGTNSGSASTALLQPKGSLIFTPAATTEFYLSAGRGYHSIDLRGVTQARSTGQAALPLLSSASGEEVGVREQFRRNLVATLSVFRMTFQSETTYNPDAGMDFAGPGSRRDGAELNVTYQALRWLEFYVSVAASHARYATVYDDGTGHVGNYVPGAPNVIGSLTTYVKDLGPWSGGLEYRYLGPEPLTPDHAIIGHGYGEWNGDAHYAFDSGWSLGLALYNILDQRANAADFWYGDRLPGEPAVGVNDVHIHPIEPRTVRFTIARAF